MKKTGKKFTHRINSELYFIENYLEILNCSFRLQDVLSKKTYAIYNNLINAVNSECNHIACDVYVDDYVTEIGCMYEK